MKNLIIKIALAWAALLLLPLASIAQDESLASTSMDVLLEQYLFPISSYLETGNPIAKTAAECDNYSYNGDWQTTYSCGNLTPETNPVRKTGDGKGI